MDFRITGLSPEPFLPLYGLPGEDLSRLGILRVPVEAGVGFPDRVEMREGRPGETMLLLNHECQPAASPYRARHAIYVREGATQTYDRVNEVPEVSPHCSLGMPITAASATASCSKSAFSISVG